MIHTYERLMIKLDRMKEKEKSAAEHFAQKEQEYKQAELVFEKESDDVERMQSESLSTFMRRLVGTQDKRMEKELREQVQAKLALDTASALYLEAREDLLDIRDDIDLLQNEIVNLRDELKTQDPQFKQKIAEEERKRLEWNQEIEEVDEALAAGQSVLTALDHVLETLNSADSLATWDLFSDSFLLDMMKYNKMDKAEQDIAYLEGLIERYRKELKDVNLTASIQYEDLGQMHRVFDLFFDNIFSDYRTKDTIQRNIANLEQMESEVHGIQQILNHRKVELIECIQASETFF